MRYQQQHRPNFFVLLLPILLVLVQVLSATTSSVNALSLTRRLSSSKIQTPTKLKRQYHKVRSTGGRSSSSSSSQLTSSSNDGVGSTTTDDGGGGTATVPEEIFNLIKSIIGAGVLSLPAGIAVLASSSGGNRNHRILLSSSFLLIAVMGTISAYTFSLIARVCHMTNTTTYADCWTATMKERSGSSLLGSLGAFMVALASTLVC
jgi:hypothetical protein